MSSEEHFDDKPLADIHEQALEKALNSESVFERSSAPPKLVTPSASSTDEFPDEPEPEPEPEPSSEPEPEPEPLSEPRSSYGHSDLATLAAAGSGPLLNPELGAPTEQTLPEATLVTMKPPAEAPIETAEPQSQELLLQPHLAYLTQVGLTDSDTWEDQIKPRIENLHVQIDEVNVRLDHLTTRKPR